MILLVKGSPLKGLRPALQKPKKFGSLTAKCSAIFVSMQIKRGTGGAINVGSDDEDDDGSVDADFVS